MSRPYRVLVAGDFHIPFRATKIPEELVEFIESNNIDLIAITGDLVQENVLEPFKKWQLKIVKGNMDIGIAERFPEKEVIEVPKAKYRVLLFHGSGIYPRGDPKHLRKVAIKNRCKVILTGHTHVPTAKKYIDTIIINPGSGTGVLGGAGGLGVPTWSYVEFYIDYLEVEIYAIKSRNLERIIKESFDLSTLS